MEKHKLSHTSRPDGLKLVSNQGGGAFFRQPINGRRKEEPIGSRTKPDCHRQSTEIALSCKKVTLDEEVPLDFTHHDFMRMFFSNRIQIRTEAHKMKFTAATSHNPL